MKILDLSEETKTDYFTCLEEWSDEIKDGVCRKECWYNSMQEKGLRVKLASNDAGVIAELADRVAVMYAGKIMEIGDAVQMFHHPAHPYTMGLMASFPTIAMMRMRAGGKRPTLRGIPGEPPVLTNLPSGCPFHPRCSFARDICISELPEFREVGPRHWIRCHRYAEISEEAR